MAEPVVASVIASNLLCSALYDVMKAFGRHLIPQNVDAVQLPPNVSIVLSKATTEYCRLKLNDNEAIQQALCSTEADSIFQRVFKWDGAADATGTIEDLAELLSLKLDHDKDDLRDFASHLFHSIHVLHIEHLERSIRHLPEGVLVALLGRFRQEVLAANHQLLQGQEKIMEQQITMEQKILTILDQKLLSTDLALHVVDLCDSDRNETSGAVGALVGQDRAAFDFAMPQAMDFVARGRPEEARQLLLELRMTCEHTLSESDRIHLLKNIARCNSELNDFEAAITYYEMAGRINDSAEARLCRVRALRFRGSQ